ncbi:hypothetical protein C8Q74DRAFT_1373425 [Fomes fomentarius]|nr:hypothetical protein C8Q74DRAFT_1373425 [Fomes fomentarius]
MAPSPIITSIATQPTFNMSSKPDAWILTLLVLTFVFCVGSAVVVVQRRRRSQTQQAESDVTEALVKTPHSPTLSSPLYPSSGLPLPATSPSPRPLSQGSFVSRLRWMARLSRLSRDVSTVSISSTCTPVQVQLEEVQTFEDFVQPQVELQATPSVCRSSSLTSVSLESPVLVSGEFRSSSPFSPPSSPSGPSIASTPSLASIASTPSIESSSWEPQTPTLAPVVSPLYSTKRLSFPFDDAWTKEMCALDVYQVSVDTNASFAKLELQVPSQRASVPLKKSSLGPLGRTTVTGIGRGWRLPVDRPSSVMGIWHGGPPGMGRGVGLRLRDSCASQLSPSSYSSTSSEDLSIFDDADDESGSMAASSSSRTIVAGASCDDELDADWDGSEKRLSELLYALDDTAFSLSSMNTGRSIPKGEDMHDDLDYDDSEGDSAGDGSSDGDLEHLEDVVVHLTGRSRREAFVYAI